MRIAYCVENMYNSRGTERVLTTCANILSDYYDITIITESQRGRRYYFDLNDSIHCHDLCVDKKISRESIIRKKVYKRELQKFLIKNQFDIVISLGGLDMFFLHSIKDGSKKILWFHFSYNISNLFVRQKGLLGWIIKKIQTRRRVYHASKYDRLVVLSKTDLHTWRKHCNNVCYIYNPLTIKVDGISDCTNKRAIAVGVLGVQKGFDYLIDAWSLVHKKHPAWSLDIFGQGPDFDSLNNQIAQKGLEKVVFLRGISNKIQEEYKNHSLYILSSRYEGFGLVLVEASACGLPLISFDCPQGPNEIIQEGKNGFLVSPVGDVKKMANRINLLVEDSEKRREFGRNALKLSERFSKEVIKQDWISLFNDLK
ncbi:MAG: glycosyltransferase family 4 protein [Bacteroidales bacterium]|nr:glycosyltransferase family 4 protein [Bacteroidales bacterium]